MHTLGISALAHDSAAAVISDNGIAAAMEESKLVRTRTAGGIPREAILCALKRTGTSWRDLDCIAVAMRPPRTPQSSLFSELTALGPLSNGNRRGCMQDQGKLRRKSNGAATPDHSPSIAAPKLVYLEHHLCHAASAFYPRTSCAFLVEPFEPSGLGGVEMRIIIGRGH